mgnify:CR=1 FL=1
MKTLMLRGVTMYAMALTVPCGIVVESTVMGTKKTDARAVRTSIRQACFAQRGADALRAIGSCVENYLRRRRRTIGTRPMRPVPRRAIEDGSGVVVVATYRSWPVTA